jgi:hypothetical protein
MIRAKNAYSFTNQNDVVVAHAQANSQPMRISQLRLRQAPSSDRDKLATRALAIYARERRYLGLSPIPNSSAIAFPDKRFDLLRTRDHGHIGLPRLLGSFRNTRSSRPKSGNVHLGYVSSSSELPLAPRCPEGNGRIVYREGIGADAALNISPRHRRCYGEPSASTRRVSAD